MLWIYDCSRLLLAYPSRFLKPVDTPVVAYFCYENYYFFLRCYYSRTIIIGYFCVLLTAIAYFMYVCVLISFLSGNLYKIILSKLCYFNFLLGDIRGISTVLNAVRLAERLKLLAWLAQNFSLRFRVRFVLPLVFMFLFACRSTRLLNIFWMDRANEEVTNSVWLGRKEFGTSLP